MAFEAAAAANAEAPTASAHAQRVLLRGRDASLLTDAPAATLAVPLAQLGVQVARHFAGAEPGAGLRLAGALPFDRTQRSHLLAAGGLTDTTAIDAWLGHQAARHAGPPAWSLQAQPARAHYEASVARCIGTLRAATALRKVVLARTLLARAEAPVDPWWLVQRLGADPQVLRFVVPLPVDEGEAPAWLVGATPERLLARRGDRVLSEPLAGSAPRLPDAAASRAQAEALQGSAKDQQEHRYVVQAIGDLLAPLCRQLKVPAAPSLHATASMWHLGTRIEGQLKDASPDGLPDASSAALAALLHPTPAVGGTPRDRALQAIAELEPVPRGFYAGAVGWCDARGDGDWHVALRCARVQGREARLFAGAGIVADSLPASEGAETRAKFNAMLDALGIDAAALRADL